MDMSITLNQPRHFTEIADLNQRELKSVIDEAMSIHSLRTTGPRERHSQLLQTAVAFLSTKESLRTQASIGQAAAYLGGQAVSFGRNAFVDEQGQPRESMHDMVRCLEEQGYPIIFARLHTHQQILEMVAACKSASTINALTDRHHPLQALADIAALKQCTKSVLDDEGKQKEKRHRIAFMGDGNNVATSLGQATAILGWDFVHSGPETRKIPDQEWKKIKQLASTYSGSSRYEPQPEEAVEGATLIYTDVFASMGEKSKAKALKEVLAPYKVTSALMERAGPNALFGHCLPAERDVEVDSDVIDGPQSIVYTIAGYRMDTTAALMRMLLETNCRI